jgi:hypothetical protein
MHANVPLAAPVIAREQDQNREPERVPVPPGPVRGVGEPAWEAFYGLVFVASTILVRRRR